MDRVAQAFVVLLFTCVLLGVFWLLQRLLGDLGFWKAMAVAGVIGICGLWKGIYAQRQEIEKIYNELHLVLEDAKKERQEKAAGEQMAEKESV